MDTRVLRRMCNINEMALHDYDLNMGYKQLFDIAYACEYHGQSSYNVLWKIACRKNNRPAHDLWYAPFYNDPLLGKKTLWKLEHGYYK